MTAVALVRRPGPRLAEGIVTFCDRRAVDLDLATKQWESYVDVLRGVGMTVVEVPAADDCPDAVFVEDTVVVHRNLAVLTHPGAAARRPEVAGVRAAVEELGFFTASIRAPGNLDGGDVLPVGSTVYVGRGGRTNAEGVRQLRELLAPWDLHVVAVPLTRVLHLTSAVTALPDGTLIGYPSLVEDVLLFPRFVPALEESGAHVLALTSDRLLVADDCPRTARLLEDLGYGVERVDVSEFAKLDGSVTCLSVIARPGTTH